MYLLEWPPLGLERDAAMRRFATRYAKCFARSGHPVPPEEALFVLAAGVHELACSQLRAGSDLADIEDVLVGTGLRLAGEEEPWT